MQIESSFIEKKLNFLEYQLSSSIGCSVYIEHRLIYEEEIVSGKVEHRDGIMRPDMKSSILHTVVISRKTMQIISLFLSYVPPA